MSREEVQGDLQIPWKDERRRDLVEVVRCGHRIAERPLEVYCNIMCKWVNEKDYCTMFEPGQGKMKKTETQI